MKLTISQKKLLARYYEAIAIAWFTGGVIASFFSFEANFIYSLLVILVSIFLSILFLAFALIIIKKVKE